jgi:hypothetical protein
LATTTFRLSVLLLNPGEAGSAVVVDTVAIFVSVVPRVAVVGTTTIVIVLWAALAMVPKAHVTCRLPVIVTVFTVGRTLQLPLDGVADTNSTPRGKLSLTTTPAALDGPLFRAVST